MEQPAMKYTTIAVLSLQAGTVLGLTDAQALPRSHALAPLAGRAGWYTTTGPVQLKVGEVFLCDDELPKHLAHGVDFDGAPKRKSGHGKQKAKPAADGATSLALDQA
jgi:hypothetical protein